MSILLLLISEPGFVKARLSQESRAGVIGHRSRFEVLLRRPEWESRLRRLLLIKSRRFRLCALMCDVCRDILRFRNFARLRNSDSATSTSGSSDSETPWCPDSETPPCHWVTLCPYSETQLGPESETPLCADSETPLCHCGLCADSETPLCPDSETPLCDCVVCWFRNSTVDCVPIQKLHCVPIQKHHCVLIQQFNYVYVYVKIQQDQQENYQSRWYW